LGIETINKSILAGMTKEERVLCDVEHMPKKRCTSNEEERHAKLDYSTGLYGEAEGK
jgi:hypothetical protein